MTLQRSAFRGWLPIVGLVMGGLLLVIGALVLAGVQPAVAFGTLVKGSLGSPEHISKTLERTTPLLIAGLAAFIALRVGLFNIGVEGQLVLGALAAGIVAVHVPGIFGIVLAVLAAMVAGALWALPAALIKAYRGGHEVITTIMLNNISNFLVIYLAAGPLKAPGQPSAETAQVPLRMISFPIGGLDLSLGLILGLIGVIIVALWFGRTVTGFEWLAVGANVEAAKFAGVSAEKVIVRAMLVSGAIAGFAGAVQVLAFEGRFYPEISSGIGFDALGVALLAGPSAFGILVSALGFGILSTGGTQLAIIGVPKGITGIVLGALILIAAVFRYRKAASSA